MRLERHLVLNRYLHHLLGAEGMESMQRALGDVQEGPGADGQSFFFHRLTEREGVRLELPAERLREYDTRIMGYEERLRRGREGMRLKYFQYLALLYTEILLDRLTGDPGALLDGINGFLGRLRAAGKVKGIPDFEADDLRRMAFFMATGAGKTLLLHANLWQADFYLRHGRHPEALVRRADARREFDGVYLITPNEGLSDQHLEEFARSGIDANHLVHDPQGQPSLFGPRVQVVEISKLSETATGDGLSVPLEELGSANLVFVDEGHKGTGSEAQTWKSRQKRLSGDGMLLEYSATFAQAIGAANSARARETLLGEYGKSIVFDYSYRYFYNESFGKDFSVLNLQNARDDQAHDLLLGGLLIFYQQVHLFGAHRDALRPYGVEAPLWVFLGSKVAVKKPNQLSLSDVATAVEFLRRFLEDRDWAVERIGKVIAGESGFTDAGRDLFQPRLRHLHGDAAALYDLICGSVFRGRGGLEVWELKQAAGELGLRASTAEDAESAYFGVVNIGDVPAFRKHLAERSGIEVRDDRFTASLFAEINRPGSAVSVLIGAKKFVEGWSSWRVSTMGLLNMGQGEGPQVIQLFGRGVRLRGRGGSLRRSAARRDPAPDAPPGLKELETLEIFGWNANYLEAFRAMLAEEEIRPPVDVPLFPLFPDLSELPVPRTRPEYSAEQESWTLQVEPYLALRVDLTPRAAALAGGVARAVEAGDGVAVDFRRPEVAALLDVDALYASLLAHKNRRGYENLRIPRDVLTDVLHASTLRMGNDDARSAARVQQGALRVLTTYVDRWIARQERAAETRNLQPAGLVLRERVPQYHTVRVASEERLAEVQALIADEPRLRTSGLDVLPRLHADRHLWSPLLLQPEGDDAEALQLSPPGLKPGEAKFLRDLQSFWNGNREDPVFAGCELYVLRNAPGTGIGFFRRSGFFPDFIVWLVCPDGTTRVRFVEPHGMHHGGLSGRNQDKVEAFRELWQLSQTPEFRGAGMDVGGYLVTQTRQEDIPGAERLSRQTLAAEHRLLFQDGDDYVAEILKPGTPAGGGS